MSSIWVQHCTRIWDNFGNRCRTETESDRSAAGFGPRKCSKVGCTRSATSRQLQKVKDLIFSNLPLPLNVIADLSLGMNLSRDNMYREMLLQAYHADVCKDHKVTKFKGHRKLGLAHDIWCCHWPTCGMTWFFAFIVCVGAVCTVFKYLRNQLAPTFGNDLGAIWLSITAMCLQS